LIQPSPNPPPRSSAVEGTLAPPLAPSALTLPLIIHWTAVCQQPENDLELYKLVTPLPDCAACHLLDNCVSNHTSSCKVYLFILDVLICGKIIELTVLHPPSRGDCLPLPRVLVERINLRYKELLPPLYLRENFAPYLCYSSFSTHDALCPWKPCRPRILLVAILLVSLSPGPRSIDSRRPNCMIQYDHV
jgi:hypothetical protein